jgi:hypothetical protein
MIEFPSIINSSKAPRKHCYAFDKLDGSNFRAKYTQKRGFDTFGTRTQLIDETTEFWGDMVYIFNEVLRQPFEKLFKSDKDLRDYREIIVFGEYVGDNSFAGRHLETEKHMIFPFDVLVGHKQRKFLKPKDFVEKIGDIAMIPEVVYTGNLNEEFIKDVREGKYPVKEGVICKGTETSGAFSGGVWTCKIKTNAYIQKLKETFGHEWEKYGE